VNCILVVRSRDRAFRSGPTDPAPARRRKEKSPEKSTA
jgi:hypothetical protein